MTSCHLWNMVIYGLVLFVQLVFGIAPPAFKSNWMSIEANGYPSEVEIVVPHNLSGLPMKVEVQIKVVFNSQNYYFNALNSAQTGNYSDEYGGVIYMFNETHVHIIAPGPANCFSSCNGYIVYLGGEKYTGPPGLPKKFKSGFVRVRAWEMCEFGKPSFLSNVKMRNVWQRSYGVIYHHIDRIDLLIAHVHLDNGYVTHAEGSASVLTSDQPFGGVMFAYDHMKIRYWTTIRGSGESEANGVPFSAVYGWGITGDFYYDSNVDVYLFAYKFMDFDTNPRLFSLEINKGYGSQDLRSFNVTSELVSSTIFTYLTMSPEVDINGGNYGYKFMVPGSTMASGFNTSEHYGSLVFGYSKQTIYMWQPPHDGIGCLIAVGGLWGDGEKEECSTLTTVNAIGVDSNSPEDVCRGLECSASAEGPMCNCGGNGFVGQFCTVPIKCLPPTEYNSSNTVYTPHKVNYDFEEAITFSCVDGYQPYNGNSVLTCTHNTTWSEQPLVCERISCDEPDVIDIKSSIVNKSSIKYEGIAVYMCDPGYGIVTGDAVRICMASGNWSGTPPMCNVSCGEPLTNGGLTRTTWDGNTVGMYANYTCSVGYENPTGSMSRLCQPDGIWDGDVASCSVKYCDVPAIGTYSNIDYATLHYQSTANYACDDGFVSSADKLTTELTSTCQDDKTWNPGPLNCTRVECPIPSVGSFVAPFGVKTYYYEDTISYNCLVGFVLESGNLVRTCIANGTWSGDQPNCHVIKCPTLGNITKGAVIITGVSYGSQAVAVCEDGAAVISGDVVRSCDINAEWTGATGLDPICEDVYQIRFISDAKNNTGGLDNSTSYYASNLVLDAYSLSKYKRSKRSMFYSYPSHIALGTCGILVIVSVCSYICLMDLIKLNPKLKNHLLMNKKQRLQRAKTVYKVVYVSRK